MQMPATETLRDRLLREFGVDLPIRDGSGQEAEPIVVTAADLQEAVDTQMEVLRCLGEAHRVAWRLIGQELVSAARKIVRADIETVAPHEHEVVSRKEARYFVLEALSADGTTFSLPVPTRVRGPAFRRAPPSPTGLAASQRRHRQRAGQSGARLVGGVRLTRNPGHRVRLRQGRAAGHRRCRVRASCRGVSLGGRGCVQRESRRGDSSIRPCSRTRRVAAGACSRSWTCRAIRCRRCC